MLHLDFVGDLGFLLPLDWDLDLPFDLWSQLEEKEVVQGWEILRDSQGWDPPTQAGIVVGRGSPQDGLSVSLQQNPHRI